MKKLSWLGWLVVSLVILGYFGYELLYKEQKPNFLPGAVTHGHFQIEMACDTCHTDPFGGGDVLQDACVQCHGEELKESLDSHPRKKFTDPRNADLLEILDARYCTSCHMEHQNAMISDMGVSLPSDYCFHCHEDIGDDRVSHKDLPYDSCQSAGCHNYHDNRALYEDFLLKHAHESDFKSEIFKTDRFYKENLSKLAELTQFEVKALTKADADQAADADIVDSWVHSSHGEAGVNCQQCHGAGDSYTDKPGPENCKTCHGFEVETFLLGKHGMRLAAGLAPMSPSQSALAMHRDEHKELSCNSCHSAHEFDTQNAAVDACLGCHDDEHSNNFKDSKHFQLFAANDERGVSCATCHMPKEEVNEKGMRGFKVNHNQNDTLRPNEKMIRPACLSCHGLQFSLNALADEELVKNNFQGLPKVHIESIEWAEKRNSEKPDSIY